MLFLLILFDACISNTKYDISKITIKKRKLPYVVQQKGTGILNYKIHSNSGYNRWQFLFKEFAD